MKTPDIYALRLRDVLVRVNRSKSQWYNLQKPDYCKKYNCRLAPPPRKDGKLSYWLNIDIDNYLLQGEQQHA